MMMYILTLEQKNELVGQFYAPNSFFNPVQDINGDWFITEQEVNSTVNPDFLWVSNLSLAPFIPPPIPENRQEKVDVITAYMRTELTPSQFRTFMTDVRNHLLDYVYYSETLYYWVETTNNADWGNYSSTGFKTRTTYRGTLVDGVYPRAEYILSILLA